MQLSRRGQRRLSLLLCREGARMIGQEPTIWRDETTGMACGYENRYDQADNQRLCPMHLFIPARNRQEAERDPPPWACRFAASTGGFLVFDSEEALQEWKATASDRERKTSSK